MSGESKNGRNLTVVLGDREYHLTTEQFVKVYEFVTGLLGNDVAVSPGERTGNSAAGGASDPATSPDAQARTSAGTAPPPRAGMATKVPAVEAVEQAASGNWTSGFDGVLEEVLPDFKRSECLLVKEDKPKAAFAIFRALIRGKCINCPVETSFPCETLDCRGCTMSCPCKTCEQERPTGLCLTRMEPNKVRLTYNLQVTPIYWLSKLGHDSSSLDPTNLGKIAFVITEFMTHSRNPVILLEGIEYLILNSGFDATLKFIDDINESIMAYRGRLIVPISPQTVEYKQLSRLERFMKVLEPSADGPPRTNG